MGDGPGDGVIASLIRDYTRRYGIWEPRINREVFNAQARQVDEDTWFMSGDFASKKSYQDLRNKGWQILPFLIEDISKEPDWWRIQMTGNVAEIALGQSIYFSEEMSGRLGPVSQRVLDWWGRDGQSAYVVLDEAYTEPPSLWEYLHKMGAMDYDPFGRPLGEA